MKTKTRRVHMLFCDPVARRQCRGNFKAQLACATAIDKLKGYY